MAAGVEAGDGIWGRWTCERSPLLTLAMFIIWVGAIWGMWMLSCEAVAACATGAGESGEVAGELT